MVGEMEDMGPVLVNPLFQLLECAQVTGVKGHILAGDGPKESLFFPLVVERGLIGGSRGHEEQAQGPGPQLATEDFELLLRSRQATDGKEGVQPQEITARSAQQLPGQVEDLRGIRGDSQKAGAARGRRRADHLPGGGQEEGKELSSLSALLSNVLLRPAALLEDGAKAVGDLTQFLVRMGWPSRKM